jgi:hypothetical protein
VVPRNDLSSLADGRFFILSIVIVTVDPNWHTFFRVLKGER